MAWWDDIRDMLREDLGVAPVRSAATEQEPAPLRQAQLLLRRTARELADARSRAETVARRLARAQARLEALTRAPQPHPRYHARLLELSRAIARDSDLAGSFQAHLTQLDLLHDQISRQLRELDHDLDMARAASSLGTATRAATRRAAARTGAAKPVAKTAAKPRASRTATDKPSASSASAQSTDPATGAKGFRRARAGRVLATLEKLPPRRPGRRDED